MNKQRTAEFDSWNQSRIGIPERSHEQQILEIWCCYYSILEEFDRKVCTGGVGKDGNPLPVNGEEESLINFHAVTLRGAINGLVKRLQIVDTFFERSRSRIDRMSKPAIKAIAQQSEHYDRLHEISTRLEGKR